jgi:choline-glycine betaine transporter
MKYIVFKRIKIRSKNGNAITSLIVGIIIVPAEGDILHFTILSAQATYSIARNDIEITIVERIVRSLNEKLMTPLFTIKKLKILT